MLFGCIYATLALLGDIIKAFYKFNDENIPNKFNLSNGYFGGLEDFFMITATLILKQRWRI